MLKKISEEEHQAIGFVIVDVFEVSSSTVPNPTHPLCTRTQTIRLTDVPVQVIKDVCESLGV